MNITGETVVFKNKNNTGYYISTSNKKEDGTFDRNYMTIGFKKDVEVENFTKINIIDGFLTHYSYENEEGEVIKRPKIMVLDFEVIQTYGNDNGTSNELEGIADVVYGEDDDLPF